MLGSANELTVMILIHSQRILTVAILLARRLLSPRNSVLTIKNDLDASGSGRARVGNPGSRGRAATRLVDRAWKGVLAFYSTRAPFPVDMSGRQGGKAKPLKVSMIYRSTSYLSPKLSSMTTISGSQEGQERGH
ncbi:hypothetical protein AcV7_009148 [Taiwanofungus camphoratus]|nr:hypothetical protein AcV7_009148 [Antrodia cinnamomea]